MLAIIYIIYFTASNNNNGGKNFFLQPSTLAQHGKSHRNGQDP